MPLRDTEVVFFDAGGTLLHPHPSVGEIYAREAARFGSKADAPLLEKLFREVWHERDGMGGLESHSDEAKERAWWYETVQQVFSRAGGVSDFDRFFHELYDLFARPEVWRLYPGVVEVLREVRRQKKCVAIVSNWDSRLFKLCDELGLTPEVDFILASAVFGAAKPSPRIFEEALRRAEMDAARCVHVGDSLSDDIAGAGRVGIRSVLIDHHGRYVSGQSEHAPDFVIHSLRELL